MSREKLKFGWESWLADLDRTIRSGRTDLARSEIESKIREAPLSSLPRSVLLPLAALCRRTGVPSLSVRLLNPVVRPSARSVKNATSQEQAEYAASLAQIGAEREALDLLRSIDRKQAPQAMLYECFARIARWDYRSVVPILEEFLQTPGVTPYQQRIAQVNLASALVYLEDAEKALPLLERLIRETEIEKNSLLNGNLIGLRGQLEVRMGSFVEASRSLDKAGSLLGDAHPNEKLLLKKWIWISKLKTGGASPSLEQEFRDLRTYALNL